MTHATTVGACLLAFAMTVLLTGWFRRFALSRQILDIPNPRSSHAIATPRGAGVAIAAATIVILVGLAWLDILDQRFVLFLAGAGALLTIIGHIDDRVRVSPLWRLVAQLAAAAAIVTSVGEVAAGGVFSAAADHRWLRFVLASLYVVWLVNLTNFMDGIDALAGVEAVTVAGSAAVLAVAAGHDVARWLPSAILAFAVLGFVVWNWPPAKVFMGDAGSGFVGAALAAFSLHALRDSEPMFWGWLILLGVFVVDATYTLLRRALHGRRIYEAHRSHAYQHAAAHFGAHQPVTVGVAAINLGWLLPIATLVVLGKLQGPVGLLIAYVPLVMAAVFLRAGVDQTPSPSRSPR